MRERFIRTGPRGLSLCLCEWGPETGPVTVVLHGFLEQGAAWDAVARALDRRVVAPDHRGHGRSEHIGAGGFYHFWDYIPDVDAVIDAVSPGSPVDLVGHSMGGTMACLYAATRPDRVRRLALIEGLGPPDGAASALDRPKRFTDAVRTPPVHRPMDSLDDAAGRIRRFTPSMSEQRSRELAARVSRPLSSDESAAAGLSPTARTWSWDPLHRARNPLPFTTERFLPFLGALACPVLHVKGSTSGFTPDDHAERAARIGDLRETALPGGHMLHHDVPGPLATVLTDFFDAPTES